MSLCVMLIVIIHIMGMMACSTHRHAVTVEIDAHGHCMYDYAVKYPESIRR